jgi:5-(carboxyamino)imidazole ribonucleotide synthase
MLKPVGVIGGGQLAQMIAIAAQNLDVELIVQSSNSTEPAAQVAKSVASLTELVANCDVITFENEFVDLEQLKFAKDTKFIPATSILKILVDKYNQRTFLCEQGILVPFFAVDNQTELENAAQALGFPLAIKTRRHGYDGKGTKIIYNQTELLAAWQEMNPENVQNHLLLEAFVPFERELAIMVARTEKELVCYPVVETQQKEQVCERAIAPANVSAEVAAEVKKIATQIATSLNLVGILGIELFLLPDGKVLVNEIAPRVHNSAHYSIEACYTSQFSQLVRILKGMPLGNPDLCVNAAVMVNLLGFETHTGDYSEVRAKIAELPKTYVHWYGKDKSLPGRKLGHVTIIGENSEVVLNLAKEVERLWYG